MSSPFITVRYPDEEWELAPAKKVPKAGDTLRRNGRKWIIANTSKDADGHVIVTWRPAPRG